MKGVRIGGYSGLFFPAFGLNAGGVPYLSVFSPCAGGCGPE